MSLKVIFAGLKQLQLACNGLKISVFGTAAQERYKGYVWPKKHYPRWFLKQQRTKYDEELTPENKQFLQEIVQEKYGPLVDIDGRKSYLHSPLKKEPVLRGEWFPRCRRTGLIGLKIGYTTQWFTDGTSCKVTLIQIIENHVIRYTPPAEVKTVVERKRRIKTEGKMGCLLVGAVNCDPQLLTREYCGLFSEAGVMPKKLLTKFFVHPSAAIQPGTQLFAAHFKAGDFLDISGVTINRGFQGVMKRWGFHGMPASHGQTKTHRRPGNIGGGLKARVWPGKKMPGVMGNKLRTIRGVQILRIDHKYNVLYINGPIPGDQNTFVYLHDTVLPLRQLKEAPRFPTYYPEDFRDNPLPEEEYHPNLFNFSSPSVVFEEEKVGKKKKI